MHCSSSGIRSRSGKRCVIARPGPAPRGIAYVGTRQPKRRCRRDRSRWRAADPSGTLADSPAPSQRRSLATAQERHCPTPDAKSSRSAPAASSRTCSGRRRSADDARSEGEDMPIPVATRTPPGHGRPASTSLFGDYASVHLRRRAAGNASRPAKSSASTPGCGTIAAAGVRNRRYRSPSRCSNAYVPPAIPLT